METSKAASFLTNKPRDHPCPFLSPPNSAQAPNNAEPSKTKATTPCNAEIALRTLKASRRPPDFKEEREFEPRPSISSLSAVSPTYFVIPASGGLPPVFQIRAQSFKSSVPPGQMADAVQVESAISHWTKPTPKERLRVAARNVASMHHGKLFLTSGGRISAGPGADLGPASADLQYGHIRQECAIEITDYPSIRASIQGMKNREFVDLLSDNLAWSATTLGQSEVDLARDCLVELGTEQVGMQGTQLEESLGDPGGEAEEGAWSGSPRSRTAGWLHLYRTRQGE